MEETTVRIRIATYLFASERAIVCVEGYGPRQKRWFVLRSGFMGKEDAQNWIATAINTSRTLEVSEVTIPLPEAPNG